MTRASSAPPEIDPSRAAALADRVGLSFRAEQAQRLAGFARLLRNWNAVHNLTAIRAEEAVETHHLLDSLAIVAPLRRLCPKCDARLIDVGSGGGLPGIPVAIACPELRVTLLDSSRKKCAFLTQARVDLQLKNVEVVHARVEQWRAPPFDVIVSRAFASLHDFVVLTRHLLDAEGIWLAMKGPTYERETGELPPGITIAEVLPLRVPGLNATRNAVVLRKASRDE